MLAFVQFIHDLKKSWYSCTFKIKKIYSYFSINFTLRSITKTNTPSTSNATPISIAIKTGCDAKNVANITVKIPKIKIIIEEILCLPTK